MTTEPRQGSALTHAEAARRARTVRDPTYDVELDLRADSPTFASRSTVRFAAKPGASTFIDFAGTTVDEATLNGRPLPVAGPNRIQLPDLRERNELKVRANATYSRTGLGLHRFHDPADGAIYSYSQCQPFAAHRIFPCFDQPDLKARIGFTVLARPEWVVVSNSPGRRDGSTWRFARTPPIPTYVSAVVAGPFHHVHDNHGTTPLGLYCRRSLAELLRPGELFSLTKRGLTFYTTFFGRPYPFSSYDHVFVPEFPLGGMENPGCVVLDERHLFRSAPTESQRHDRAAVMFHEMAHMWFGNLVTMRWWDDLWLNEAFATYAAALGLAGSSEFGERTWTDFAHRYKARVYADDQGPSAHPVRTRVTTTEGLLTRFDDITYAKGAALLRQLAHWVGSGALRAGIRRLMREHAFGTADHADVLRVLGEASGRDLARWARQWLETTGVPTLRADTTVGTDGRYTAVCVRQTPPGTGTELRDQRIAVGHYVEANGALVRSRRVEVDLRGTSTPLPELTGEPAAGLLLLNDDDLGYAKLTLDSRSVDTLIERLSDIRSGMARIVCWTALWEMVRDAELPTRDWVRLVVRHAAREPETRVRRELLSQATYAADMYSFPHRAGELRALLAAGARSELDRAEPGSTAQRDWARHLVTAGPDPSFAHGLLTGETTVPGLVADVDLRWHVVIRLATLGAIDEPAIAAQRRLDPSDAGRRRGWLAWASLPDPAVKSAAFTAALDGAAEGSELSLATRHALLTGFWRPGQDHLLTTYAEQAWVDAISRLWTERRSEEERLTLTAALYPACRPAPAILAAAERLLAGDLPGAPKHIVREGAAETALALRAQDADQRAGRTPLPAKPDDPPG